MTLIRNILILLCACFSSSAWAEGAHRYFDCRVTLLCNAAGVCASASEILSFHLAPLDADESGSGSYTLSYLDQEVEMRSLSYAGPYVWQIGTVRHTLLASSETKFLWHQLSLETQPTSSIRYLQCSLRF